MMLRCWLAALFLTACSFASKVPASANISCADDGECPPGLRCQAGTHRCVQADRLDDVSPAIVRAEVTLTPTFGNPLANPTALGLSSTLELRLTATEPLDTAPGVTVTVAGEASTLVVCTGQQTSATTSQHRCGVTALRSLESSASLVVTLTDLAKNEATLTLATPFTIDTNPPSPPEERGALLVATSPWGDAETGFRPSTRVLPSRPLPGVRQLLFRKGGVQLGTATLDDAGTFSPVELLRADDQLAVEAASVDEAGNVSDFVALGDEVWMATFKGKVANQTFPNPHRLQVTRAIGRAIEGFPFEERGERDGVVTDGGTELEVEGAGTWLNLRPGGAPGGSSGLASVGLDPLRSRIVAFGGARIEGSELTVSAETWEWNGRDWRERQPVDPESDGNPEGRAAAASTWDPSRRAFVIAGGLAVEPLNDVWAWNGSSWKRLPDLPRRPRLADGGSQVNGRIGSLLYWDAALGRLVFTGGVERVGANDPSDESWSLEDRTWVPMPTPPFGPRAAAAIATDTATGITAVVGGSSSGEIDVWIQRNGTWQAFDAGTGPGPRGLAAAASFPMNGALLLHGGVALDGTVLDDLWVLSSAGWRQLDAGVGPGARSGHAFIFDPIRSTGLLFGHALGTGPIAGPDNDTWEFDGRTWLRIARQVDSPGSVLAHEFLWLPTSGPLFSLTETSGVLEVSALTNDGWLRAATDPSLPRVNVHMGLVPMGAAVVAGGDDLDAPARLHLSTNDGGWTPGFDLGLSTRNVQGLTTSTDSIDLLWCCSEDAGTLMLGRRRISTGVLTTTELTPPMMVGAVASVGARGTAVLGRETRGGTATLSLVDALGRVTSSSPMPGSLVQPRLVTLTGRDSLVMPGGQSFTGTNTDAYEFRFDAGWQRLPLADPEGDGQPFFGANMTLGTDGKVVMALDRDHVGDGVWILEVKDQRPGAIVRFSLDQLPPDAVITEATLEVRCGGEAGEGGDGGVGVIGAVRSFGVWVSPALVTRATANRPAWGTLRLTGDGAETLRRRDGELSFLLTPDGPNERTFAKLTIDAVQLRVQLVRR